MIHSRISKTQGVAMAAALSLTGLLALSGCEERPYPTATRSYEAPRPPPATLAGAPAPRYAPPPVRTYAPPPPSSYAPPSYAPPTYAPPPPARYESTVIVGMAPIPNPGEYGSEGYYQGRRPHSPSYGAPVRHPTYTPPVDDGYTAPPPHKSYHHRAPPAYAAQPPVVKPPVYKPAPTPTYVAKPPVVKPPVYKPEPPKPTYVAKPPVVKPPVYKPEPPKPTYANGKVAPENTNQAHGSKVAPENTNMAHAGQAAVDKTKVAAAAVGAAVAVAADHAADKTKAVADKAKADVKAAVVAPPAAKPATPATGNSADRSTRLAALQSALTDAVSKGAVLTTPPRFTANTPADVTLTVPAGFYDNLHKEAEKNGLTDAAASVNMTAVLSGDGFSVTPDETQSVPLTVGQPTEFRWTVTAQPGAKGPLHADVGADLLGGGSDTLALGSVQKAGGFGPKITPQIIGGAILVLVAALVVAWLARGRGPTRSSTARRASRAARGARPLHMGEDAAH